ncbi:hypothetical protein BKA62DRAFT_738135 [Auriculariales sp. MPI-PUGE-AT-0066]|nr:hypothetical protein BKA62DRAFT_738135 [Auriculariales sp. MPI-PUGE-AT-0066]
MSAPVHLSEQLAHLLGSFEDYARNDFASFEERFSEDMRREHRPSGSLNFPGYDTYVDKTREQFVARTKTSRQFLFRDDFKQDDRVAVLGLHTASTQLDIPDLNVEIVLFAWFHRDAGGKIKITRLIEFLDSAGMNAFSASIAAKMQPPSSA